MFLDQISYFKKLGRGFEDYSANLDYNLQLDIKILGGEFQMCGWTSEVQISDTM